MPSRAALTDRARAITVLIGVSLLPAYAPTPWTVRLKRH